VRAYNKIGVEHRVPEEPRAAKLKEGERQ
jgi:hypothetical protein